MKQYWLLTWTTYGTWLPGDARGFVSNVKDESGNAVRHNDLGMPYDVDMPNLRAYIQNRMTGKPVYLKREHAEHLLRQFRETSAIRGWEFIALAVMANHLHLVVGAENAVKSDKIMDDYKSYGTRVLNKHFEKEKPAKWWTVNGSRRKLGNEHAVRRAIEYVRRQEHPLLIWVNDDE